MSTQAGYNHCVPKPAPTLYLLHGDDEIAMRETIARLYEQLGEPSMRDLNTTRLEGRGLSLAALRDACGTAPFIARRRMVIVEGYFTWLLSRTREADDLSENEMPAAPGRARGLEDLTPILEEVPPSTALVFIERRTLPGRHAMLAWCATQGERAWVRHFEAPRPSDLPAWILRRAEHHGGRIEREAAQQLALAVGEDLSRLDEEVAKLLTYVDRARPVKAEDVRRLTPESAETDVFAMVDAIGQRDGPKATRLLHKMLGEQDAGYIMGMVVRQLRLLLLAREALDTGPRTIRLGEALRAIPLRETERVPDFVAEKLEAQARRFNLAALDQWYGQLRDLDEDIKTGKIAAGVGLEAMLAAWCTR
jgi:DNA polymerase-3 subunit delta